MNAEIELFTLEFRRICALYYGFIEVKKMNALGLSLILKMGCFCTKEVITINSQKYYVLEQLGEGYVVN